MGNRLYDDMSISEVRLTINIVRRQLNYLYHKDIEKPFNEKDYKLFHSSVDLIDKLDSCRWTKDYY